MFTSNGHSAELHAILSLWVRWFKIICYNSFSQVTVITSTQVNNTLTCQFEYIFYKKLLFSATIPIC